MPQNDTRRRVLVAVVTWNSSGVLPELLDTIPEGLAGEHDLDILIVDNGSTDITREIARSRGLTVLNTGANIGYAGAINRAYEHASPDQHVLVLNPDSCPQPGALEALLTALDDPTVGIAVPRLVDDEGNLQHSLRRRPTALRAWGEALLGGHRAGRRPRLGETIREQSQYESPRDVDWASGAVMLVSAECRARLGSWDPTFFLYSEETDYMLRAGARGTVGAVRTRARSSRTWAAKWSEILSSGDFRSGTGSPCTVGSPSPRPASPSRRASRSTSCFARSPRPPCGTPSRVATAPRRGGALHGVVMFAGVDWWYHNRAHSDVQLAVHAAAESAGADGQQHRSAGSASGA